MKRTLDEWIFDTNVPVIVMVAVWATASFGIIIYKYAKVWMS